MDFNKVLSHCSLLELTRSFVEHFKALNNSSVSEEDVERGKNENDEGKVRKIYYVIGTLSHYGIQLHDHRVADLVVEARRGTCNYWSKINIVICNRPVADPGGGPRGPWPPLLCPR